MSANIIHLFPNGEPEAWGDIDLETAADVAIRDLRDVEAHWGSAVGLQRLRECREFLAKAFRDSTLPNGRSSSANLAARPRS